MRAGNGEEPQAAIIANPRFHTRGDYARHVPLWDKAFGDRVLYIPFGWLKTDPERVMRTVESFLGLTPYGRCPSERR